MGSFRLWTFEMTLAWTSWSSSVMTQCMSWNGTKVRNIVFGGCYSLVAEHCMAWSHEFNCTAPPGQDCAWIAHILYWCLGHKGLPFIGSLLFSFAYNPWKCQQRFNHIYTASVHWAHLICTAQIANYYILVFSKPLVQPCKQQCFMAILCLHVAYIAISDCAESRWDSKGLLQDDVCMSPCTVSPVWCISHVVNEALKCRTLGTCYATNYAGYINIVADSCIHYIRV